MTLTHADRDRRSRTPRARDAGRPDRADLADQQDLRPPAERLVRRGVGPRGDLQGAAGPHRRRSPTRPVAHRGRPGLRPGRRLLAPTGPAVEGQDPRRRAAVPLPRAALQPRPGGAPRCRPRRRSTRAPPCPRSRSSSGTASSGSGSATPTSPTRDLSPTCTRWTRPSWAGDGETIAGGLQLPARAGQPDGPHPRGVRALLEHRAGRALGVRVRGDPRRPARDRESLDARHRGRRRSG